MKRILIIKHGALGDVVRTAYILPGLSQRFDGDVYVDWLTAPSSVDLLRYNPYVDRVLTNPQDRAASYDWVISLDDEDEALRIASSTTTVRLSGAYVAEGGEKLYTDDVALWFDMGLLSRYGKVQADQAKKVNTLSHAQIFSAMLDVPIVEPVLFNSGVREYRWRRQIRPPSGRLVGINPFAGARWTSKAIPLHVLVALIDNLLNWRDGDIGQVAIFSELRQKEVQQALQASGLPMQTIVFPDTRESPLEFAAAVAALDYLISSDSLGLHLAIAQFKPNLSFYAPTSAAEIETFGSGVKVLSNLPDYCCYSPSADNSDITAERIFDQVQRHWAELQWLPQRVDAALSQ